MSSLNSPPLNLELRALRLSTHLGYVATVLGGLTPWVYLPPWEALGLGAAAATLCYLGFRRARWVGGHAPITRLCWQRDGRWSVDTADGHTSECELHHSSRVFAQGAWLCLRRVEESSVLYRLWVDRSRLRYPGALRPLIVRLRLDQASAPPVLDANG